MFFLIKQKSQEKITSDAAKKEQKKAENDIIEPDFSLVLEAYMQKKELLIEIITKLLPYWELAEGYLLLLQTTEDQTIIDQLYTLFLTQIKSINSTQAQESLRATLQKLKKREEKEQQEESAALEQLLENLPF